MTRCRSRWWCAPWLLAVAVLLAGCGARYMAPPAALVNSADNPGSGTEPVVVVARFDDPDPAVIPIRAVGAELGNALGRTLAQNDEIEVWFDPGIGRTVSTIIEGRTGPRSPAFGQLRRTHPRVRYVVLGQVTDFRHVREDPRNFVEKWFVGRRQRAMVAIEFQIVDVQEERMVLTDHVMSTMKSPDRAVKDIYAGVVASSYLFWNTPLGKAGALAVRDVSRVIDESGALEAAQSEIRVLGRPDERRLRLSSGGRRHLIRKGEYYVCRYRPADGRLEAIPDAHTRRPLQATVRTSGRGSATAWLQGRVEPTVQLRGAVLVPELPLTDPVASPAEKSQLAGTRTGTPTP